MSLATVQTPTHFDNKMEATLVPGFDSRVKKTLEAKLVPYKPLAPDYMEYLATKLPKDTVEERTRTYYVPGVEVKEEISAILTFDDQIISRDEVPHLEFSKYVYHVTTPTGEIQQEVNQTKVKAVLSREKVMYDVEVKMQGTFFDNRCTEQVVVGHDEIILTDPSDDVFNYHEDRGDQLFERMENGVKMVKVVSPIYEEKDKILYTRQKKVRPEFVALFSPKAFLNRKEQEEINQIVDYHREEPIEGSSRQFIRYIVLLRDMNEINAARAVARDDETTSNGAPEEQAYDNTWKILAWEKNGTIKVMNLLSRKSEHFYLPPDVFKSGHVRNMTLFLPSNVHFS